MAYGTCPTCTGSVMIQRDPEDLARDVLVGHLAPDPDGLGPRSRPRHSGPRCAGSFGPPVAAQAPSERPSSPTSNS